MARLLNAARYSMNGLKSAFRNEAAFRQEVVLSAILLPLAIWVSQTFLEAVADSVTIDEHPLIAQAKDLGSAAVLLAIALAVLAWAAVIWS